MEVNLVALLAFEIIYTFGIPAAVIQIQNANVKRYFADMDHCTMLVCFVFDFSRLIIFIKSIYLNFSVLTEVWLSEYRSHEMSVEDLARLVVEIFRVLEICV